MGQLVQFKMRTELVQSSLFGMITFDFFFFFFLKSDELRCICKLRSLSLSPREVLCFTYVS